MEGGDRGRGKAEKVQLDVLLVNLYQKNSGLERYRRVRTSRYPTLAQYKQTISFCLFLCFDVFQALKITKCSSKVHK